ncbi:hypothetical protein BBJ28_00024019 [Nothophytophthora sp. Chile5]|nr:hypothetical protein BBJ28_00024019 [Nothophytophthora sp. Chile5]
MGNNSSSSDSSRPQVPDKWGVSQIPSQKGKLAVVTGANSGLGYETALQLARKGAHVVLACRNEARGREAEANIRELLASDPAAGTVEFMQMDVSDLSSVKTFSEEFAKTHKRLDLLVNNAGVMAVPYSKTVDGYERQFSTNHLGHFALTAQLFPLLRQSAPSRIVNVSSHAHRYASLSRFTASSGAGIMYTSEKGYSASVAYGESKLCNLLFTMALDRRLRAQGVQGVTAVACHPGFTASNLTAAPSTESNWFGRFYWRVFALTPVWQDVPTGTLPSLFAATGSLVQSGDYYGPGGFMGLAGPPMRVQPRATAYDEPAAQALWDESERLAKVKFAVQQ